MLVARSKTDFVFIFFILGTFLVLKGGWGTPKVGRVEYSIRKLIGRCVGNLGNIVCTSNPNNGQGHQNAQGLAAMRHFTSYKPRRRLDTHEWYKLILGHVKSESRSSSVSVELTKHLVAGKVVRHPGKLEGLRPA